MTAEDPRPAYTGPAPFDGPVLELRTPLPLDLAVGIFHAVGAELERRGFYAYCKQETGLGVIHARRVRDVDPDDLDEDDLEGHVLGDPPLPLEYPEQPLRLEDPPGRW